MDRRQFLLTPLIAAALVPPRTALATPSENAPRWTRDANDARWVQGRVIVPVRPEIAWKKIERVDQWRTLFSDIKTMRATLRDRDEWRLNVETFTFDCGPHDYDVHLTRSLSGTVWIGAPGIDAIANLKATKTDQTEEARLGYSLFVDVRKLMPWFGTEAELRKKQERMVERYLADLERAFQPARV